MSRKKYFGTDGIRGSLGKFPITPDFMLHLGWAVGMCFRDCKKPRVLIGKDTRISGYMFESALESGLLYAGVDVLLLGPMPTPSVAYLTRTFYAQAGIVISASHNTYEDNGVKIFCAEGNKISDEIEYLIEKYLEVTMECSGILSLGKAHRVVDAPGRYIEFCKATAPRSFDLSDLTIVLDCAHGATYHIAPKVFGELGASLKVIGDKPNGYNINDQRGSTELARLCECVIEENADLGIAFDGDGDRVMMVDSKGNVVDGDDILFVLAKARHQQSMLKGGVVGTQMSNFALELHFKRMGIRFLRSDVGDRHVLSSLHAQQWVLGGEPSGHIVCLDKTTTGDGIVTALQVLGVMLQEGKGLFDLLDGFDKVPQVIINVNTKKVGVDVSDHPQVIDMAGEIRSRLGDEGRLFLRPSGTEPVFRIMVEGLDRAEVESATSELAQVVESVVDECE